MPAGTLVATFAFNPNGPSAGGGGGGGGGGRINRVELAWVSNSSGAVSEPFDLNGEILKVQFIPAAGGAAPTDNYDVTILDLAGIDVLKGVGANHDTATAEEGCPAISATNGTDTGLAPQVVAETLTLTVANAGNAKAGTVVIYFR